MTNLVAADLTYTVLTQRRVNGRSYNRMRIAFGDSTLTYPAGGIPITKGKLGCPNDIESLTIVDDGISGYKFSYKQSTGKLVMVRSPAATVTAITATLDHSHDLLVKGGQAGSTTNDIAHYATDILGKEAVTDATILGSASATKGGVISKTLPLSTTGTLAAGTFSEASTVAIAAQTIEVEVIGW